MVFGSNKWCVSIDSKGHHKPGEAKCPARWLLAQHPDQGPVGSTELQDCLHRSRIYAGAWSRKKGVLSARIRNDQYSVIVLNKNLLVLFLLLFFFFFFLFFFFLLLLMMTGTSLLAQMSFKVANERIRLLKHVKAFWLHMLSLTMSGLAIKMTQSSKQPTTKWQSEPAGMKRW